MHCRPEAVLARAHAGTAWPFEVGSGHVTATQIQLAAAQPGLNGFCCPKHTSWQAHALNKHHHSGMGGAQAAAHTTRRGAGQVTLPT